MRNIQACHPWRHKAKVKHIRKNMKSLKAGNCVYIDTFCSTVGGLIPQATGTLTIDKFEVCTFFLTIRPIMYIPTSK